MGSLLGSHAYAHCGIATPRLAAGGTDNGYSPQLTERVLQKTRLRRSELAYLIHGVLQTHFNNHYFTLTQKSPLRSYQSFIRTAGQFFPFIGQLSQKYFGLFLRLFPPIHGKPSVYGFSFRFSGRFVGLLFFGKRRLDIKITTREIRIISAIINFFPYRTRLCQKNLHFL